MNRTVPHSGWSHLHLSPDQVQIWGCEALRCSTLNGSWQGQGLVSQAPPKPSHCRAFMATRVPRQSLSAMHCYFAPSFSGREQCLDPQANIHGSQVGLRCTVLVFPPWTVHSAQSHPKTLCPLCNVDSAQIKRPCLAALECIENLMRPLN